MINRVTGAKGVCVFKADPETMLKASLFRDLGLLLWLVGPGVVTTGPACCHPGPAGLSRGQRVCGHRRRRVSERPSLCQARRLALRCHSA